MEFLHIDIAKLSASPANMRSVKKVPDLANILPSVRARGVLVPPIVRQNGSPDTYEIVAGNRRYHAALAVVVGNGALRRSAESRRWSMPEFAWQIGTIARVWTHEADHQQGR